jgi:hypothetical protein
MNQDIMRICMAGHIAIFRSVPIACISHSYYDCMCGSKTKKIMRRRDNSAPYTSDSFIASIIDVPVYSAEGVK